jgi:hypothetical protein
MQGPDPDDPACAAAPVEPDAVADAGYRACASRSPAAISSRTCSPRRWRPSPASPRRWAPTRIVEIPEAARARAAAYVISTTEGASLHLDRLRRRARRFRSAVRDRLLAGAMVPAPLVVRAQKFRRWYPPGCWSCSKRST